MSDRPWDPKRTYAACGELSIASDSHSHKFPGMAIPVFIIISVYNDFRTSDEPEFGCPIIICERPVFGITPLLQSKAAVNEAASTDRKTAREASTVPRRTQPDRSLRSTTTETATFCQEGGGRDNDNSFDRRIRASVRGGERVIQPKSVPVDELPRTTPPLRLFLAPLFATGCLSVRFQHAC